MTVTKKETRRRGRPMLSRETVQERLNQLGWEIPEGVKYRGTTKTHTIRCLTCGYVTEKIIHNVVYNGDVCPMATAHNKPKTTPADTEAIKEHINNAVNTAVAPLKQLLEEQQEVILSTAMGREDLISKFVKTFNGTVARKGFVRYNREMTTIEWFEMSDIVATNIINMIDPLGKTSLLTNYAYHRKKNSNTKPEKVLLQVMSKSQLFRALEQVQLLRVLA